MVTSGNLHGQVMTLNRTVDGHLVKTSTLLDQIGHLNILVNEITQKLGSEVSLLIIKKELSTDGIHLNEKGYDTWVDFIKPVVSSIN